MTRVLDGLRAAPLLLSILYGCYGLYVLTRLRNILRVSGSKLLDTRKLLATSMFCVCFLRCLTFVTISLVNRRGDELVFHGSGNAAAIVVQGPSVRGRLQARSQNLDFFEKSMLVLFDLPDYMIVTTFTLLVLVWAEVFLDSRAHWLSSRRIRKRALIAYLVFNASVYATQLVLYSLLFVPSISIHLLRFLLYCSVSILNFFVPIVFCSLAIYLFCKLAAFPYKGVRSRIAVTRTTRVVLWWSGGRLVWAAMALSAGVRDWLTNFSGSSELFAVTLVAVFTLTELVPFSIALEPDFLPILAVAEGLEATDLIDGMALLPGSGVHKYGSQAYEEKGERSGSLCGWSSPTGPRRVSYAQSDSALGRMLGVGFGRSGSLIDREDSTELAYGTMDMRSIEKELGSPTADKRIIAPLDGTRNGVNVPKKRAESVPELKGSKAWKFDEEDDEDEDLADEYHN